MLKRFTPHDADVRARAYLALLARGEIDSAESRLTPELRTPETRTGLVGIDSLLARQPMDSMHVIGAQTTDMFNGARRVNLTYEFHTPRGWFDGNVATVDSAGTWRVDGVHVEVLQDELERVNRFTLRGRSPVHYVFLVLLIASVVISFGVACIVAFRSRMRRRWLWALLALVGIGQFMLNWTTGETGVRPLSFQLFGGAFWHAAPAAPWIMSFAFPIGAAIAYERYRRWRRGADAGKFANGLVFPEGTTSTNSATS